jgi:hypothetical protein
MSNAMNPDAGVALTGAMTPDADVAITANKQVVRARRPYSSTFPAKFLDGFQICHPGGPAWSNDVGNAALSFKILGLGYKVLLRLTLLVRDPSDHSRSYGQTVDYYVSPPQSPNGSPGPLHLKDFSWMERADVPAELSQPAPHSCTVEVANHHEKTWTHLVQWTSESNRSLLQPLPAWLTAKLDDPTWAPVLDDVRQFWKLQQSTGVRLYVKAPANKARMQFEEIAQELRGTPLLNWHYYRLATGKLKFTWGDLIPIRSLVETVGPEALASAPTRFSYFADPVEAHIILGVGAIRESQYQTAIIERVNGLHELRLKLMPSGRTYLGIVRQSTQNEAPPVGTCYEVRWPDAGESERSSDPKWKGWVRESVPDEPGFLTLTVPRPNKFLYGPRKDRKVHKVHLRAVPNDHSAKREYKSIKAVWEDDRLPWIKPLLLGGTNQMDLVRHDFKPVPAILWHEQPVEVTRVVISELLDKIKGDFGLDESQRAAILQLADRPLSLITGPPGTGKTEVIANLVEVLRLMGLRVLLCAPSNFATINAADKYHRRFPSSKVILLHQRGIERAFLPSKTPLDIDDESEDDDDDDEAADGGDANIKIVCPSHVVGYPEDYAPEEGQAPVDDPYAIGATEEILREAESAESGRSRKQRPVQELSMATAIHEYAVRRLAEFKAAEKDPTPPVSTHTHPPPNPPSDADTAAAALERMSLGRATGGADEAEVVHKGADTRKPSAKKEDPAITYMRLFDRLRSDGVDWYKGDVADFKKAYGKLFKEVLKDPETQVVASTLNSSDLLKAYKYDVLITDEAGQASEAELMIPLRGSAKAVVLVGDERQLPPTVMSQAVNNEFHQQRGISPFERLKELHPSLTLRHQYRCIADCAAHTNAFVYGGQVINTTPYTARPNGVRFVELCERLFHVRHSHIFVDVHRGERQIDARMNASSYNLANIDAVCELVGCLVHAGFKASEITIITPYNAQLALYLRRFRVEDQSTYKPQPHPRVCTVDTFQGQENEVIITDLVVTSKKESELGFVKKAARLTVALSRARCGQITVGRLLAGVDATMKSAKKAKGKESGPQPASHASSSLSAHYADLREYFIREKRVVRSDATGNETRRLLPDLGELLFEDDDEDDNTAQEVGAAPIQARPLPEPQRVQGHVKW